MFADAFSVCRMKCIGRVNGKECGSILLENAKICPTCGTAAGASLTIHCPCGATLRGEHKFCYSCVAPVQLKPASTPKVCPAQLSDGTTCGFTLIQGLNFCPKCGARSSPKEDQPPPHGKEAVCSAQFPDGTTCGFPFVEGLAFCPKCGARKPSEEDQQILPENPGAKQEDDHSNNAAAAAPSSAQGQLSDATDVPGTSRGEGECRF